MSDRDRVLSEFRVGVEGIDPVLDQAANYGKGVRAVQSIVREQGQVMSQALANNHQLYYTNKNLTAQMAQMRDENQRLVRRAEGMELEVERARSYIAKIEAAGGDRYKPLFLQSQRTMMSYLYELLEPDQLKAKLEEMQAQAKEIDAMPDKATAEEINAVGEGFEDL